MPKFPCGSRSMPSTRLPWWSARQAERLTATVVLPVPPLALARTMVFKAFSPDSVVVRVVRRQPFGGCRVEQLFGGERRSSVRRRKQVALPLAGERGDRLDAGDAGDEDESAGRRVYQPLHPSRACLRRVALDERAAVEEVGRHQ